jgi:predicted DNA-binding ribbon-helix-helix protein
MDQLEHAKKRAVIKRSILVNGHRSSVSLENEYWRGLHEVGRCKNMPVAKLVDQIDHDRDNINLSSAIRVFVFKQLKK